MRKLSDFEILVIEGVAKLLPPHDAERLLDDLRGASVDEAVGSSGRTIFSISGYKRPAYRGQHQYVVEVRLADADGADLTAVLYADENGRLYELEIIRWADGELIAPDVNSLTFY